jgi:hypothetical protein
MSNPPPPPSRPPPPTEASPAATQVGSGIGATLIGEPEPEPTDVGKNVGEMHIGEPSPGETFVSEPRAPAPPIQATRVARPARKGRGAFIATALGFVVLLVGGVVAWKVFLARPPILPFALGKLPGETETILRVEPTYTAFTLHLRPEDVPDQARWSAYGESMCGGTDIFQWLLGLDEAHAKGTAELLADKDHLKATLSCGKAIFESMGKNAGLYRFTFKKGKQHHVVLGFAYAGKDLPDTTKLLKSSKDPDHLENTRCVHPKDEAPAKDIPKRYDPYASDEFDPDKRKRDKSPDADCPRVIAKIEKEKFWITGDMPALKEFGDEFSPEAKNRLDEAKLYESVLLSQHGDQIAAGHGENTDALEVLGSVADEEIRDKSQKALRDAKVWGASVTLDGPFETDHVEYHAGKESDAQDIEDALFRYIKELKRVAKDAERDAKDQDDADSKKDDKAGGGDSPAKRKFTLATLAVHRRALEEATIERSGSDVVVTIADKPDDAEKKAWKDYADENRDRAKKVTAIVDALMKGNDVSDDDLKALSGKLFDTLHPAEYLELTGLGGFRVPGGGECYAIDPTSQSCTYAKLDRAGIVAKLKEQAEKAGFEFASTAYSDSSFLAKKDSTYVSITVFENSGSGAHVTLALQPPPVPAPASTP